MSLVRAIGWSFTLAVFATLVGVAFGESSPSGTSSESLEYKLAVVNAGTYVPQTDTTVTRFRYLLEAIHEKTGTPKERIGDMTLAGRNTLHDQYGKDVKLLTLMERAKTIVETSGSSVSYDRVITSLVMGMK